MADRTSIDMKYFMPVRHRNCTSILILYGLEAHTLFTFTFM